MLAIYDDMAGEEVLRWVMGFFFLSFFMLSAPITWLRYLLLVAATLAAIKAGKTRPRLPALIGIAVFVGYLCDALVLWLSKSPMSDAASIAGWSGGDGSFILRRYSGGWPWHGLEFQPPVGNGVPVGQLLVIMANLIFWIGLAGMLTALLGKRYLRRNRDAEAGCGWVLPIVSAALINQVAIVVLWLWFYD